MNLNNNAEQKIIEYFKQLANVYGVSINSIERGRYFSATPSVAQTIYDKTQESSAFLELVNFFIVDELKGEKIGVSTTGSALGTTDTSLKDRSVSDPVDINAQSYECEQLNFDTAIRYARLNQWAKFKNFQLRFTNILLRLRALDIIKNGWNGTSRSATSDKVANPMLEDVGKGWLQRIRDNKPANVMTGLKVGDQAGADFKNFNALVYDMQSSLLDPWYKTDTSFNAICASELVDEKYFPLINENGTKPTESLATDIMLSSKNMGGLQIAKTPYFPEKIILITKLGRNGESNLSKYIQESSVRRAIIDNPKRDQYENFHSANECCEIEDYGACAMAEGILTPNGSGGWS